MAYPIGFVGGGNMAEATVRGLLSAELYAPDQVILSEPVAARRELFDSLGVTTTTDNNQVVSQCETVVLAVKPQIMGEMLDACADAINPSALMISIAAGLSSKYIVDASNGAAKRVVRVMPNTPMLVGAGMSVVSAGAGDTPEDVALARRIFQSAGETLELDESLMDIVTAVSGSGPAYFFYFVEAIIQAGLDAGLKDTDADTLARQTALGAATLLVNTDDSAAELRKKVTSPGGTTEAALRSMNDDNVGKLIAKAVQAAANRSKELGK